MILKELKPRKALNKVFLKIKPNRSGIEAFKTNLITLLDRSNDKESEEFHKNLVSDFLKDTYYKQNHFINTKGRNDLVIHIGQNANSKVGVIIEAKKPTNKSEMISNQKLNVKAFQELVLYYLRERITHKNLDVKHLVATNINEWFIFDEHLFERLFAQNKSFVEQFENFEASKKKTEVFYKEIAEPYIESITSEIEFTYFNIQDYQKVLRNEDKADDNSLIALFKLLSPEHLLKLSFANDSNSLDKNFYNELLYLIGLTETKEGGKKLIERPKTGQRNAGSLLENVINQLDSLDKLSRLANVKQYGDTHEERLFTIGLELCITWVNRILFLKLLEAQLISYHKGDKSYAFLNKSLIHDYDNLNALFFMVLAKLPEERNPRVKTLFAKVPYLNSSLFEPTELEHQTLFISGLEDNIALPFYNSTVIKDTFGKKLSGTQNAIEYFFDFLDAYDFASEGSEEIQEDNKTLINASVLGLIFEKINGYKDGSFYTPSFITMYMCKETIRRAVIQKFNETKGWNCEDFQSLYNKIEDSKEANAIINSVKICDPAVGSGHFLVSALNEMITIKHDLKVLVDREGKRLKEYQVEIVNDELIVSDEDDLPFSYNPKSKERQRIQETLFHEKQTIIENCLFGVDINPNSVKICRLRLWIELLKNAYYRNETELETLPNIDINIKCGNSLISRFGLDADLKEALQKSKLKIEDYKRAVDQYRNAESKEQKREMEGLIEQIKGSFRSDINANDPKLAKIYKLKGELTVLNSQTDLFGLSKKEESERSKKIKEISTEVQKLETEIEEIKNNKIYENAFEWRFEFPEVLNEDGDFVGFDVVIGNPPYGVKLLETEKQFYTSNFKINKVILDTYILFIEQGFKLLKYDMLISYIIPSTWIYMTNYQSFRKDILNKYQFNKIIHFKGQIFSDATVETSIIHGIKTNVLSDSEIEYCINESEKILEYNTFNQYNLLQSENINFNNNKGGVNDLFNKISQAPKLSNISKITCGLTPYRKGKGNPPQSDEVAKGRLYDSNYKKDHTYRLYLMGRDFNRYTFQIQEERWISYGDWLAEPRKSAPFDNDKKIIIRQTADKIIAHLDENKYLNLKNVHNLSLIDDSYQYEYVLAILNSSLLNWWYSQLIPEQGRVFAEVKVINLNKLPIKLTINQQPFIDKVDQILTLKKDNPTADTSALEREIDLMVYELYGLTKEEIEIIENNK